MKVTREKNPTLHRIKPLCKKKNTLLVKVKGILVKVNGILVKVNGILDKVNDILIKVNGILVKVNGILVKVNGIRHYSFIDLILIKCLLIILIGHILMKYKSSIIPPKNLCFSFYFLVTFIFTHDVCKTSTEKKLGILYLKGHM
jgi:hypothetical protein